MIDEPIEQKRAIYTTYCGSVTGIPLGVGSFRQICFLGGAGCPMLGDIRDDEVLSDEGWTHLIT
jgi:hypothetical protein